MKQMTYTEMNKLWNETFPTNNSIVFSMYSYDEEDDLDTIILDVDFTTKTPLVKDDFVLVIPTWDYSNNVKVVTGVELTWEKLVYNLDEYNDGHHIFLEDITIDNNVVSVFLGS